MLLPPIERAGRAGRFLLFNALQKENNREKKFEFHGETATLSASLIENQRKVKLEIKLPLDGVALRDAGRGTHDERSPPSMQTD